MLCANNLKNNQTEIFDALDNVLIALDIFLKVLYFICYGSRIIELKAIFSILRRTFEERLEELGAQLDLPLQNQCDSEAYSRLNASFLLAIYRFLQVQPHMYVRS